MDVESVALIERNRQLETALRWIADSVHYQSPYRIRQIARTALVAVPISCSAPDTKPG